MSFQNIFIHYLGKCERGQLTLRMPDGSEHVFGDALQGPTAEIIVRHSAFFRRTVLTGDIGLGESYMHGEWESRDLVSLVRWFIGNRDVLAGGRFERTLPIVAKFAALVERLKHRRNANTLEGSRRNIEAHYDLGNDFYEHFLDGTMSYSSAFYANPDQSLTEAQLEKYERICRKIDLRSDDHVLEIGCGWGGFATYAALQYGCRVTGITLSPAQLEYAQNRVDSLELGDRISLQLIDYRNLEGQFDKVVSIEMIEAVGHAFLPTYFNAIERLLKPNGLACIQAILSSDHRYRKYCRSSDYIRKHIFPGSHLPSLASVLEAKSDTDLHLFHHETFGLHYVRTLRAWADRFEACWPSLQKLGFDDAFRRKWRLYFAYCEAGFAERHINVGQLTFGRMNSFGYRFEDGSQLTGYAATVDEHIYREVKV